MRSRKLFMGHNIGVSAGGLSRRQQCGFTLVEIMVALLLGLFLIAGILQVFISAKKTYKVQDAMSRLQENGRFAMELIGRDIRMADYRQCFADSGIPLYLVLNGTTSTIVGRSAVSGAEGNGNNSDSLNLTWLDQPCGSAGSITQGTYSIGVSSAGGFALFEHLVEKVEGIENMQVLYGVDTDRTGTPNYYVPYSSLHLPTNTAAYPSPLPAYPSPAYPPATPNLDQVASIRVSLLVRTIDDNVASEPLSYTFPPWPVNGAMTTITPTDYRIRKVFTSTFAIRNRVK